MLVSGSLDERGVEEKSDEILRFGSDRWEIGIYAIWE